MEPTSNTKHAPAGATATDATEAPSSLRVAAVQFEPKPSDKEYNIAQIAKWVEKAAQDGVQIVAFPGMCGHCRVCDAQIHKLYCART